MTRWLAALSIVVLSSVLYAAEGEGRIEGVVRYADGSPVPGVSVILLGTTAADVTGDDGTFVLDPVPAGNYALRFIRNPDESVLSDVRVTADAVTEVVHEVQWPIRLRESVKVVSPSRRKETILDAPAAVTSIPREEIDLQGASGALPHLLEYKPGIEITSSGLWDFNVNTRGYNDNTNTRVEMRIDGREFSVATFGAISWPRLTFPLDDLEQIEFLHGPSSALYGANAWSGVIDVRSREPRSSQGGTVRLAGGQLDTGSLDLRWAGALSDDWFFKVVGGVRESDDFAVPRTTSAEYSVLCQSTIPSQIRDCLLPEVAPPLKGPERRYGGLRFDRYLSAENFLTFEVGTSDEKGVVFQSGVGRFQFTEDKAPWMRVAYSSPRWSTSVSYSEDSARSVSLTTGQSPEPGASSDFQAGAQANWRVAADKIGVVAGAEFRRIEADQGVEDIDPATGEPAKVDEAGAYAQVDWDVHRKLRLIAAVRLDDSTLYDFQISPKLAAIYQIDPTQSLRFTVNKAFRAGNIISHFLDVDIAAPVDLQSSLCDPSGVSCGLSAVSVNAFGNNHLDLEENITFEIGYKGIVARNTWLTIDLYHSRIDNFLSQNLLPQFGTSLGRLNDDFGPWVGPDVAEMTPIDPADCPVPNFPSGMTVADCVRAAAPELSNKYDGSPAIAALTFTNLGKVETRGADLAIEQLLGRRWKVFLSYSWFDSDIKENAPDLDEILTPNTPENKASFGTSYSHSRFNALLGFRWVEGFRWVGGLYNGPVESYTTVDLNAQYKVGAHWTAGLDVSNLLDDEHYEAFGGNLLGRRAVAYVTYSWDQNPAEP